MSSFVIRERSPDSARILSAPCIAAPALASVTPGKDTRATPRARSSALWLSKGID
ncbi:hypothetical protein ACVWY5_000190 [Bradyrhizobium sp. USDA 3256]